MHYIIGLGMAIYMSNQTDIKIRKFNYKIEQERKRRMNLIKNEYQTQMAKLNERCDKYMK
jgi:hypothetical protein